MVRVKLSLLATLILVVSACDDRVGFAPVVDSRWAVQSNHQLIHRVQRGETLYAIAFRYDKDYRQLAAYNQLRSPYAIRAGQLLYIKVSNKPHKTFNKVWSSSSRHLSDPQPTRHLSWSSHSTVVDSSFDHSEHWSWPVRGRVAATFVPSQGKKGIDIASRKGEAVYASAPGVVAYAGSGLRGYGNLIIIKHNRQYLTAYSNNFRNLVHEGQRINAGQRIAEVGVIDRRFWGVHFEIRQSGQPVNPLNYLKRGDGMK